MKLSKHARRLLWHIGGYLVGLLALTQLNLFHTVWHQQPLKAMFATIWLTLSIYVLIEANSAYKEDVGWHYSCIFASSIILGYLAVLVISYQYPDLSEATLYAAFAGAVTTSLLHALWAPQHTRTKT